MCGAVTGTAPGLDPAQERNAKTIAACRLGPWSRPDRRRRSAVAVALAESTLFNYANDGTTTLIGSAEGRQLNDAERAVARESLTYPHDKVGNNLDSIGLFQQRPMTGWGTPAELIDPATSAGMFFDRLVQVPGWQSLPPWNAAQTVQGSPSSDGGIYRDMYEQAVGIVVTTRSSPTSAANQPMSMASLAASCAVTAPGDPALAANTSSGGSAAVGWLRERADPGQRVVPGPVPAGVAVGMRRGHRVRPTQHRVQGGRSGRTSASPTATAPTTNRSPAAPRRAACAPTRAPATTAGPKRSTSAPAAA